MSCCKAWPVKFQEMSMTSKSWRIQIKPLDLTALKRYVSSSGSGWDGTMLSMSYTDPWPEGSVGLEEEVVTAAAQAEQLDWSSVDCNSSSCSSDNLDDSLTSLQWLQEFSILNPSASQSSHHHSHFFGSQVGSDAPSSPLAGDPASIGMPLTPGKPTAASFCRTSALPSLVAHGHCPDEVDYKSNPHIKPPYSYATLICMAMQASKKTKITLSCIYKWITDNFCYFRHADPTWQVRCCSWTLQLC